MRLCTLYLCIREIRRYTDREYCATFTFCSSTVSVAIYATHKKTDRGKAVERERVKDVPQSALQCWLQAQLFSSGRASRSAFAFNFTEKRCTFNGRPMQGAGDVGRGMGRARCLTLWCFSKCLSAVSWPWLSNPANECGFHLPLSAFPFGFGFSQRYRDEFKVLNGKCIFQIKFSSNSISFKKIFAANPNHLI